MRESPSKAMAGCSVGQSVGWWGGFRIAVTRAWLIDAGRVRFHCLEGRWLEVSRYTDRYVHV